LRRHAALAEAGNCLEFKLTHYRLPVLRFQQGTPLTTPRATGFNHFAVPIACVWGKNATAVFIFAIGSQTIGVSSFSASILATLTRASA